MWTVKDGTPHPTDFWAREFMEAYDVFTDAAVQVDIATPGGIPAQVDALSYAESYNNNNNNNNDPGSVRRQKTFIATMGDVLGAPIALESVEPGRHDSVFVVGGHGPMQDGAVALKRTRRGLPLLRSPLRPRLQAR